MDTGLMPRAGLMVVAVGPIALLGLVATACGGVGDGDGGQTADPTRSGGVPTSASTTSTTSTPVADGVGVDVRVYFAADEAVATAGRTVDTPAVARGAIDALLAGPRGIETEIGQVSEIPDGTELLDIGIDDGVARVDLSGEFESGSGGLSLQLRVAQVVFTLTQFETVEAVDFSVDGTAVEAIGGEVVVSAGVDRSDFAAVTPLVLVESPVPGQAVTSPLEITGMANTFEATVSYSVVDGAGLILDEGFTTATATAGNGTFGTFTITAGFLVDRPGGGTVVAFEHSAVDGEPINVYEVPVEFG